MRLVQNPLEEVPEMDFSGLKGEDGRSNLRFRDDHLVLIDLFLEYWKKVGAVGPFKCLNPSNYPSVL